LLGFVKSAKTHVVSVSSVISNAHSEAAYQLVFDPRSPRVLQALRLAARASAALFAASTASPSNPVSVTLEEGAEPITYTSRPDESMINVGDWITSFYFGTIVRDEASIDRICEIDPMSLRGSSTRGPEYLYLYAKALRDFHILQWDKIVDTMLAAVHATDLERPDVNDKDWALWLHVPALEVLIYVVTKDAKFSDALQRAVELHKKFWSKKKDYRMQDYEGFFSVPLTALARIGLDQGLTFDVESPYLPKELLV
jgi:hypothetical protein